MQYSYGNVKMQSVMVSGEKCLFCDVRLDSSTIPANMYKYEVAGDDDDGFEPVRVRKHIMVGFYGTLLCNNELPLGNDGNLWLSEKDFKFMK